MMTTAIIKSHIYSTHRFGIQDPSNKWLVFYIFDHHHHHHRIVSKTTPNQLSIVSMETSLIIDGDGI
mgnify:FL=1